MMVASKDSYFPILNEELFGTPESSKSQGRKSTPTASKTLAEVLGRSIWPHHCLRRLSTGGCDLSTACSMQPWLGMERQRSGGDKSSRMCLLFLLHFEIIGVALGFYICFQDCKLSRFLFKIDHIELFC